MGKADVFQFVNGCGKCIACGKAAIHAVDKSLMQHALTDQFVHVIVQAPLGPLDYRVDESTEVAVGDRVLVTLGTRQVVGIVVEVTAFSAVEGRKLKKVLRVLGETEPFRREWLELMRFTANYYIRSWGEAALSSLPRFFRLPPRARRQASLNRIREIPPMSIESRPIPTLNAEQQAASRAVSDSSGFSPFVLFGVTGSGKTEVYLQIMHEVLEKNPENQVLLLVPEINLTPQLEARVRERFPEETVVTLHSALSDGDRARNWLAVHEGRARILVGTRLAIFASFRRLALILVDEEHDESYKADDGARFSARDLAIKRAQMNAVACVLGSATPSLETWEKVRKGVYRLLRLSHRAVKEAELPKIAVVDRRAERGQVFVSEVRQAVDETLGQGRQVLVFINRRGYAPTVTCPACGWVSRCLHCSGFTVFHKKEGRLVCHHCSASYPVPERCPTCGNPGLEAIGTGTQKIEEAIETLWPEARVLRIDRDSVRTKNQAQKAFSDVHAGRADIVVGTQMISKGHDFKRVGLVVVLNADALLVSPSIKAEERLFSLLLQVAGRAGRSGEIGRVLIQTRFPEHPLYQEVIAQDYEAFAERALSERRETQMPPFVRQALLLARSETLERALGFLDRARQTGESINRGRVVLYDPVPMSLMRLMDEERAQLLVEAPTRTQLNSFLSEWVLLLKTEHGVFWTVEVDPTDL